MKKPCDGMIPGRKSTTTTTGQGKYALRSLPLKAHYEREQFRYAE